MNGIWVERTPAAKRFRDRAGFANSRLNTIVVGLEAVKAGTATKPADLAVYWNPKDVKSAAEWARGYATSAVMVYVVDALDTYMSDLALSGTWITNQAKASILANEFQTDVTEVQSLLPSMVTQLADNIVALTNSHDELERNLRDFTARHFGRRKRPSMPMRFSTLLELASGVLPQYRDAIHFLISWRNRHVHGRSSGRVSNAILSELNNNADYFYENHSHLIVDRMIKNYNANGSPTLKEVSSLISVLHRVVSAVDKSIVNQADAKVVFIDALKSDFAQLDDAEQRVKDYWGKDVARRRMKLVAMAGKFGFREVVEGGPDQMPLHLSADEVQAISELPRDDFLELVGIKRLS
ncbi:hypothetical protein [uncultured Hoeflea sp.]|uniref:hypothetical protein n=1 Tax=uncultured Hoeflea sp. TaxID=538666 RepID=UPI0030D7849C|tara:strand:+ start:60 stop:1118 length:1059 start_codon:yes stop_codon:yes gene_type:complete